MEGDQNVSTSGGGGSPASSRWNPTKDQISILESLYKQGIRTPSADQIQQITGRLKAYGHIEGKNVFYWFQNHKARQRQKQKQESIAFFSRKASSVYPPPFSNGVCNPYYLPQNELGFYPQYSKVLLPAGGINTRPGGTEKMNIACGGGGGVGFESSQWGHNVMTPRSDHFNNRNSKEALTLPLFPLEPTGLQGKKTSSSLASTSAENSATPSSSSETTVIVDEGSGDQPFFDFFSGNGSWGSN